MSDNRKRQKDIFVPVHEQCIKRVSWSIGALTINADFLASKSGTSAKVLKKVNITNCSNISIYICTCVCIHMCIYTCTCVYISKYLNYSYNFKCCRLVE